MARNGIGMVTNPFKEIERLSARYGRICQFGAGPLRYVAVFGADANELILSTATDSFTWREALESLIVVDGDTALIVSDGEDHRRRRRLVQPAFATRRINGYVPIMLEEFDATISSWVVPGDVDAYETLKAALRRITIRSLFGDELAGQADVIGEILRPALDFVDAFTGQLKMGPGYRRAQRARTAADGVVRDEIARRRRSADNVDRADMLATLLDSELTEQEVLDQVISLIAAGYSTTSAAIGWGVWRALSEPAAHAELRRELGDGTPTAESLQAARYLDAFVSEVLRLHPPGFIGGRHAKSDVQFAGYTIPAGSTVIYSPLVTHRLPDLWEDPLEFRPQRWLDGEPLPYSFVPFGGGYRRCIGFLMATLEIKVALARVVQRVQARTATAEPRPTGISAMYPKGGVRISVQSRR
jgi:cytochrome P450